MKRPRILQSVLEIRKHISIIEMQWKSLISMFVGISHPSTNNKERHHMTNKCRTWGSLQQSQSDYSKQTSFL